MREMVSRLYGHVPECMPLTNDNYTVILPVHPTIFESMCFTTHFLNFRLFLAFFLLVPAVASAQDTDPWVQFQLEKKSAVTAILLEALLPTFGTRYAGDGRKSLLPWVVQAAGLGTMWVGATIEYDCEESYYGVESCSKGIQAVVWAGLAAVIAGHAWRVYRAYALVRTYNNNLKDRLGIALSDVELNIGPAPGGVSFGVSIPLGR